MKRLVCMLLAGIMLLFGAGCETAEPELTPATDLMENIHLDPVRLVDYQRSAPRMMEFLLALGRQAVGNGNMLVSPLSVLPALAMTANGAKGNTLRQMESVLGMDRDTLNPWLHSYLDSQEDALKLANSIWLTKDPAFEVKETFLKTNGSYYGAQIYQTAFDRTAVDTINGWVKENTGGMIQRILDEAPADALVYLINALAFEATWEQPYEEQQVQEGSFTSLNGTQQSVTMMYAREHAYLEDDYATGFLKYYQGRRYAFAALLPKDGMAPEEYLNTLSGETLYRLLSEPAGEAVQTAMPKFEMGYATDLAQVLQNMGMVDAFSPERADLSDLGTIGEENIYIGRVLHKTAITVAEQGTKAGAATAVEVRATGACVEESEEKTVILDRPFVYMLIDCETSLPFFIGTMEDTAQSENAVTPKETLEAPPSLRLRGGRTLAEANLGGHSWSWNVQGDEWNAVMADAAHPLQCKDLVAPLAVAEEEVLLDFAVKPDSWEIVGWETACYGDPEAPSIAVTKTGSGFVPKEGSFLYMVTARWDRETYNGNVSYYFQIDHEKSR